MAYSIDFRRKVLEIKEREGLSFEKTALRFGISESSVFRWSKRLEHCLTRNKPATKIDMEWLALDVKQEPDAYQHERAERFKCSQRGICEALNMPRIFGCSGKGLRCFGKHDWQAKRRTNAVGALTGDKLLTAALFDCSINTDVFEAWIRQELLPVLPNGHVVVMDNASFHKSEKIKDLIESARCLLDYLPSYSPDLNPIENKWAQAKARRRKLGCTVDEIFQQPDL